MSATFAKQEPNDRQGLTPSCKRSTESNSQSVDHATTRFIAASMTGCVLLIWHTTHILQRNVGDSVRAWCMEIVHAMVRGRAVGKGLVYASTSLAAYPTASKK